MAENFPNLKKEGDTQVQEAQRVPNNMSTNRLTETYHDHKGQSYRGF